VLLIVSDNFGEKENTENGRIRLGLSSSHGQLIINSLVT